MLGKKKLLMFLCAVGLAFGMVTPAAADLIVVDIDTSDHLSDINPAYWSGSDFNHADNLNNSGEATQVAWLNALIGLPMPPVTFIPGSTVNDPGGYSLNDYDPGFDWDYAIVKYAGWWDAYEDTGDDELLTAATSTQKDISHVDFYVGEPVPEPATMLLLGSGLVGLLGLRRKFRKK